MSNIIYNIRSIMKGQKIESIILKPDFKRWENIINSTEILHNDSVKRLTISLCKKKKVNMKLYEIVKNNNVRALEIKKSRQQIEKH